MDESLQDLENELKSLRPRGPSARLVEGVGRALADPDHSAGGTKPAVVDGLGWRLAAVAACLTILLALGMVQLRKDSAPVTTTAIAVPGKASPSVVTEQRYEAVAATNVLYDLRDEGLVGMEGDTPLRQVRYRYLDTYTWASPTGDATLKWSVPRDEIRVLPASLF